MPQLPLTIDQVKEILPDVTIRLGRTIETAHVRGRLNRFATVWTESLPGVIEYSWHAVTQAINTGAPLLL